jgi:hypothetical protein
MDSCRGFRSVVSSDLSGRAAWPTGSLGVRHLAQRTNTLSTRRYLLTLRYPESGRAQQGGTALCTQLLPGRRTGDGTRSDRIETRLEHGELDRGSGAR